MHFKGNLIYTAMVPLIREMIARQLSSEVQHVRKSLPTETYLEEYCTLKLHAGRQMGHTSAILKMLGDVSAPSVLVTTQAKRLDVPESVTIVDAKTPKTVENDFKKILGTRINLVVVDMASLINPQAMASIKEHANVWAITETTFLLVLLG